MTWDCHRLRAAIVDFADGELAEPARTSVERHLSACPSCSDSVLELRETPGELRRRLAAEPSESFWTEQRAAILRAVEKIEPAPSVRRAPRSALASGSRLGGLAAAAAAALLFVRLWSPPTAALPVTNTEPAMEVAAAEDVANSTSEEDVAATDPWAADDNSLLSLADELGDESAEAAEEELI